MPKKISSPSSRWPGAVIFSEPLNMSQALAWERAIRATQAITEGTSTDAEAMLLPGIFACIDKWELEGLPETVDMTNFPASPRRESAKLVSWLIGEVTSIYAGTAEVEDPNG